jgi:hypothetical protein
MMVAQGKRSYIARKESIQPRGIGARIGVGVVCRSNIYEKTEQ